MLVDASSLIYLAKAEAFREAHASIGEMLVPPAVWREAVEAGIRKAVPDPEVILRARSAGWVRTIEIPEHMKKSSHELSDRYRIGEGESQVLAMAQPASRVVIDDLRATRVAVALGCVPVPTVFLPILGMRERGLSRQCAMKTLQRLARVVTLSVPQLVQLETILGEQP